jgi:hypothetical protein
MLMMVLTSHAGDDIAEASWLRGDVDTESCWQRCCRVMLVMTLSMRLGWCVMSIPSHADDGAMSHAGDGTAEAAWLRRDTDAELC